MLFLHHLLHTLSSFFVGDGDEVDAGRQAIEVNDYSFAIALCRGHKLTEGIVYFGLLDIFIFYILGLFCIFTINK